MHLSFRVLVFVGCNFLTTLGVIPKVTFFGFICELFPQICICRCWLDGSELIICVSSAIYSHSESLSVWELTASPLLCVLFFSMLLLIHVVAGRESLHSVPIVGFCRFDLLVDIFVSHVVFFAIYFYLAVCNFVLLISLLIPATCDLLLFLMCLFCCCFSFSWRWYSFLCWPLPFDTT